MKYLLLITATILLSLTSLLIVSPAVQASDDDVTKITLTIGDTVIPAVLNDTDPARDLIEKLPVTVSLNRGPVDYCGGIDPIKYEEDDVQEGYRSGDLAYWIPGQDFVIFLETEEASPGTPGLVMLGQISTDIEDVLELDRSIKVTIALDEE